MHVWETLISSGNAQNEGTTDQSIDFALNMKRLCRSLPIVSIFWCFKSKCSYWNYVVLLLKPDTVEKNKMISSSPKEYRKVEHLEIWFKYYLHRTRFYFFGGMWTHTWSSRGLTLRIPMVNRYFSQWRLPFFCWAHPRISRQTHISSGHQPMFGQTGNTCLLIHFLVEHVWFESLYINPSHICEFCHHLLLRKISEFFSVCRS